MPSQHTDLALSLLEAWQRLAKATRSRATLCDLILILSYTSSSAETRLKPVSTLNSQGRDIRLDLNDRRSIRHLLEQLSPFWEEATYQLIKLGFHRLKSIIQLPKPSEECVDLYLWNRCQMRVSIDQLSLTQRLARFPLAFVHGDGSPQQLEELLDLFEYSTYIAEDTYSPAYALHLISHFSLGQSTAWLTIALERSPAHLKDFIQLLIRENPTNESLESLINSSFDLSEKMAGSNLSDGWGLVIKGIKQNVPTWIINWGLRLWKRTNRQPEFESFQDSFPFETAEKWIEIYHDRFVKTGFESPHSMMNLFNDLGAHPQLADHLDAVPVERLPGYRIYGVWDLLINDFVWDKDHAFGMEQLTELVAYCENTFQLKADSDNLGLAVKVNDASRQQSPSKFRAALKVCSYYEQKKQSMNYELDRIWFSLITAAGESADEWMESIPSSAFKQVHRACRSDYRCEPLADGNKEFCIQHPIDATKMMQHFPNKYLSVMHQLGSLGGDIQTVLRSYKFHPLNETSDDYWLQHLSQIRAMTDAVTANSPFKNPFPKRLAEFLDGERQLESKIIDRDRDALRKNLIYLRLEILENEIHRCLDRAGAKGIFSHHTIALAKAVDQNKRTLKRFIQIANHADQGAEELILQHPRNQSWLMKMSHAGLNMDHWLSFPDITPPAGLTIHQEHNPDEVLKMGSYVGSCLSLGACNAFSTVANMYDLNKQVIYLRDEKGKVLGRQLVAISEQRELVCFHLFPY
ncbi:MAG: hypothetical protein AAF226_09460, partial [Verrucomicrobiota bacterium]